MHASLFISSVAEITKLDDTIEFNTYLKQRIKEAFNEDVSPAAIEIATDSANAFRDAQLALEFKTKLSIDSYKQKLTELKTKFKQVLFLLNLAKFKLDKQFAIDQALFYSLSEYPRKMDKEQLFAIVRKFVIEKPTADALISQLTSHIAGKEGEVRQFHQITDTSGVKVIEKNYSEVGDLSEMKNAICLITGPTGSGKTINIMKPTYESACKKGLKPIFINGSRALARSMLPKDDFRFYMHPSAYTAPGLLGVVFKTMLDEIFERFRTDSKLLLADEIENVYDLGTSEIAGDGSLEARITLNERMDEQVRKSETVLVADAMLSMNTFNRLKKLAKESGKKIYIYKPKVDVKRPTVTIMSEKANIAKTQAKLVQGQRVLVACDKCHNQTKSIFNARFEGFEVSGDSKVKIDAAFMQKNEAKELENPDKFADKYQLLFVNAAAKNGLSITHKEFRHTSLLTGGTDHPNDQLQYANRGRLTEEIYQSFNVANRKLPTNTDAVLTQMILQDKSDDFTVTEYNELMQNDTLRTIAERIAFKNKARKSYEFTTITMFKQNGYTVQYLDDNNYLRSDEEAGQNMIKNGEEIEAAARQQGIISATKINKERANELRSNGQFNSQKDKDELESFDIRHFYNVVDVEQSTFDFDSAGKGRSIIRNHRMAAGEVFGELLSDKFKSELVQKVYSIIRTNEEFNFSSAHGDLLHNFINYCELHVNTHKLKVKDVFFLVFPDAIIKKNSSVTIKNLLTQDFGMEIKNGKNENYDKKNGARSQRITKYALIPDELAGWLKHLNVKTTFISSELTNTRVKAAEANHYNKAKNQGLKVENQDSKNKNSSNEAIKQLVA